MSNAIPNETLFPSFRKVDDLYPMGLDIPKTNDIKIKNIDIPIVSNTPKHVYYNFYPMLSNKINTFFSGNIQYQISGKINEPNVIFSNGSQNSRYTSKKLYIFNKIHENEKNTDGELIIENDSITNSDKKLFICFPLKTNNNPEIIIKNSILDELIQNTTSDDISEINLNSIILKEDDCFYYETSNAKVIVFQTPIVVSSYFTGFTKGELYELQKNPENIEKIHASTNYSSDNILSNLSKMIKGLNIFETKESFIEGIENNNSPIKWMECDNVPLDYTEEIPTYQIAGGSVTKDYQGQLLGATINIIWVVSIIVFLIFILPSLYTLIVRYGIENDPELNLELIRNFEFTWVLVLLIPAIIMIFVGALQITSCNNSLKNLNDTNIPLQAKDMDKIKKCLVTPPLDPKIGDNYFVWPNYLTTTDYLNNAITNVKKQSASSVYSTSVGGIMLALWSICFVIMCFYKVLSPNFMYPDFSFIKEDGRKILALPIPSSKFFVFWINILTRKKKDVVPV